MFSPIQSFEQACAALNIDPSILPNVSALLESDGKAQVAHYKLSVIARALNDGWKPDWTNDDEYKYYPWFDMSSVSGLSFHDYDCDCSASNVGSRLCYKSRAIAEYAGKQFIDLYTDMFLL